MQNEFNDLKIKFEQSGFIKYNNIKVEEIKKEYAKLSVKLSDKTTNPSNITHGGLIFTLADSAMGLAARTNGRNIVTVNANIDNLKKGIWNILYGVATPVKIGTTLSVYTCDILNEKEELIAKVTGTFYYLD